MGTFITKPTPENPSYNKIKDENMKLQQIQSILECLEEEKKIYAEYLQITENRRLTVEENIQLNMKKKAAENRA